MYPVGTYDRFIQKIKGREGKDKPRYLGILFCDIEQSNVKEYIMNYLEVFDKNSSKHFDFYIPGYLDAIEDGANYIFEFKDVKYEFNRKVYNEFCNTFSSDFDIPFPYVSTLVLLEYESGNFKKAKKCVFNLEQNTDGLKDAGRFFDLIFKSAEENNELQSILDDMLNEIDEKPEVLLALIDKVLSFFSLDFKDLRDEFKKSKNNRKQYTLV